jgi:broad specificity phosphatase PhoE
LRDGGYVIVFRHGATYQDQADTHPLNPSNVAKQRQLNDDGRALAKSIGKSLHKLRIPVGQIHSSLFQRAIDTGALMGFGDVEGLGRLHRGWARGYSDREHAACRSLAQDRRNDAFKPDGNGGYEPIVRIQAGDWSKFAQAVH